MRWITRERPKIDRVACPWLITRFIDQNARFLFAPAADVLRLAKTRRAIPFDIDGGGPLGTSLSAQFSAGRAAGVSTGEHGVTLTQVLSLVGGIEYTFEFDWAATRTVTTSNTQGGIFALMVDGAEINRSAAGSTSGTLPKYGHHVGTFTPGANGNYTVGVWILRPFTIPTPTAPTLFQNVDNFEMSAVPEPGTIAVLGLGAAALLRRRRRQ